MPPCLHSFVSSNYQAPTNATHRGVLSVALPSTSAIGKCCQRAPAAAARSPMLGGPCQGASSSSPSLLPAQPPLKWGSQLLLSHSGSQKRGQCVRPSAGALDVMPAWTLDQIAGLLFGALMLASVLGAKQLDVYVARQQRRQLGLCEECGGLFDPSCCLEQQCPLKGSRLSSAQQQGQQQTEQTVSKEHKEQ